MSKTIRYETLTRERAQHDAGAILALGADNEWEYWSVENLLSERPDKWLFSLLATSEGVPVAYAVASRRDDAVHLHHLIVGSALRGAGIGSEMMRRLMQKAQERGAAFVTLKVYRVNQSALRFYQKHGFDIVGDKIVGDEQGDLISMKAALNTLPSGETTVELSR